MSETREPDRAATYRNRPTRDFTMIRNAALRDPRLDLKAKGMLALMLSFPDDWTYHQSHLEGLSEDGAFAHRSAIAKLIATGYVKRDRVRNEDGTLAGTAYIVTDDGLTADGLTADGKTYCGSPYLGSPYLGSPQTSNTDSTKTEIKKMEGGEYQLKETPVDPAIPPPPPPSSDRLSAEERFTIKATTGVDPTTREHEVRDRVRIAAGKPFILTHDDRVPGWSREHTPDAIDALWAASRPDLWKGTVKESKRREWIFLDLLNQDVLPPAPPEVEDHIVDGNLVRLPDGSTAIVNLVTSGWLVLDDGRNVRRAGAIVLTS